MQKEKNMRMKRMICGLLCLILALSMAACGSTPAAVTEAVNTPETVAAPPGS